LDEASGEYSAAGAAVDAAAPTEFTFEDRAAASKNAAGKAFYAAMLAKQSNLCVAADVTSSAELIVLAEKVAPYICCLKTHCDIVSDWTAATAAALRALADKHNFLIFEDRKFADIGNTVVAQCKSGVYKIASWADFVNAHSLPGPGIVLFALLQPTPLSNQQPQFAWPWYCACS
jgi:orotidine-5'-phosphate decarboxylase